jgi:hypothetical protein
MKTLEKGTESDYITEIQVNQPYVIPISSFDFGKKHKGGVIVTTEGDVVGSAHERGHGLAGHFQLERKQNKPTYKRELEAIDK